MMTIRTFCSTLCYYIQSYVFKKTSFILLFSVIANPTLTGCTESLVYPNSHWVEVGYTLDKSTVYYRADIEEERSTVTHSHTYTEKFQLSVNLTCMFLDCGRRPEFR